MCWCLQIAKELAAGKSIQRVMTEMCGAAELEPGHANGQVKSFQIVDGGLCGCRLEGACDIAEQTQEQCVHAHFT